MKYVVLNSKQGVFVPKMPFPCGWLSSVCRQKRILILLCTFGSSFIAFNYSLLSSTSTTTTQPVVKTFAPNKKIDDNDSSSLHKYYQAKLDHHLKTQQNHSKVPPEVDVSTSPSHIKSSRVLLKTESLSSSSSSVSHHYKGKSSTLIKPNTSFLQNPPKGELSETPVLSSATQHAQKPFKSHHRHHHHENKIGWKNESHLSHNHKNISLDVSSNHNNHNNDVKFITSAIEEKSDDKITTHNSVVAKKTKDYNKISKEKTDDQVEKPEIVSPSSSLTKTVEKSTVSAIITTGFPRESNIFISSLIHLSTTAAKPEYSSSWSPQSEQMASLRHTSLNLDSGNENNNNNNNSNHPSPLTLPISPKRKLPPTPSPSRPFRTPPCNTAFQLRRIQKRKKNLTVIENFIMGWQHVKCDESITYTTHGDYRYLDNLVPLVDRWNGPVSLAIYCPGEDLDESLKLISYLKLCTSSNIDKWVTFHLIYDTKYVKRPASIWGSTQTKGDIPWLDTLYQQGKWKDCSLKPTFSKGDYTFRIHNGLLYPINIARNIARSAATTHFVLTSDIELYPSINLIPGFMEMLGRLQKKEAEEERINYYTKRNRFTAAAAAVVAKIFFPVGDGESGSGSITSVLGGNAEQNQNELQQQQPVDQLNYQLSSDLHNRQTRQSSRHVFVLPVFEVKKEIAPCQFETKKQLVSLLKYRAAVIFHHSICPQCHTFPKYEQWKVLYPGSEEGIALEDYRKYNCANNSNSTLPPKTQEQHQPDLLKIFHKTKREHPFQLWEPIFIGTKEEPIYDERLSWEGLRDKMISGYIMCALDYDFYIMDNAFLVHKPGIRRANHMVTKTVMSQDRLINYRIRAELLKKFGKHDECAL